MTAIESRTQPPSKFDARPANTRAAPSKRDPLRIALVGRPGSGKGTQAEALARALELQVICLGDLLRGRSEQTSGDRWHELPAILERGDLVPDELVLAEIRTAVAAANSGNGCVLDGFPRNLAQAWSGVVPIDAVVNLELSDDSARQRLAGRGNGRRDDANPDGIENRLRRFHSDTEPLLDLYARRGILTTVDASVSAEATTSAILGSLRVIRRVSPAGSWLL